MAAVLIENGPMSITSDVDRVRPERTRRQAVRSRAEVDPRRRVATPSVRWAAPVSSCAVVAPRPRVTLQESSVMAPVATWHLTDRGWAVVVLAIALLFALGVAVMVGQFLAITAG